MDYKYTGIILGKYDVGETDRIYSLYTKEAGKMRVLAAGVRKAQAKLAGHLEPVTLSEIFVAKRRGMGKITGAIATDNFPKIKSDFDSLAIVMRALSRLERFSSAGEKDEKTFELLLEFLETMEKISGGKSGGKEAKMIIAAGFIFKFLDQAGYRAEASRCVACAKKLEPKNNFFSAQRGGVLCASCGKLETLKLPAKEGAIKLIRIFLKNKIKNLDKIAASSQEIANVEAIAEEYFRWIAG